MALHLVLLPTILAFALTRNEQCVPSPTTRNTTMPTTTTSTTTPKACPHSDTLMPGTIEPPATEPTSTTTTATPPTITNTTSTTTTKSCPHSGYQLYPEFNCYKAFSSISEWRTWSEARDRCMRDGGDLMVMETERERQDVFIPLYKSVKSLGFFPWMGVYKPEGEDSWMTVNGEPASSTWWYPGHPVENADRKCALADSSGPLGNFNCEETLPFICEIAL